MRFFLHEGVEKQVGAALVKQEHAIHAREELGETESMGDLFAALTKKQWGLVIRDAEMIRKMYEEKLIFGGVIVLLASEDGAEAVDRLFERYKRLTPKRMYTVTGSRVKVRQLPGAV